MKLRWKWMTNTTDSMVLTHTGLRILGAVMSGMILLIAIGAPLDLLTSLPDWAWITISQTIPILYVLFGKQLMRLHYLYGLNYRQSKAIEFYDKLSKSEKNQLPKDFESVIKDNDEYVAQNMQKEAEWLITAYREKKRMYLIAHPDDRIEAQLQIMRERREAFRQEIEEEVETRRAIERMP